MDHYSRSPRASAVPHFKGRWCCRLSGWLRVCFPYVCWCVIAEWVHLPGGSLALSMSRATTLMIMTQTGLSSSSASDLTKAMLEMHWHSRRRLSGYACLSSRLTFAWNFFMSNNWKKLHPKTLIQKVTPIISAVGFHLGNKLEYVWKQQFLRSNTKMKAKKIHLSLTKVKCSRLY